MPDSIYNEPPPEGCEQHGWVCVYHKVICHNPSDCDFVPLWIRKPEFRDRQYWRRWAGLSQDERQSAIDHKRT